MHRRAKKNVTADLHTHHVEDHAVKVEKDLRAEGDIITVIAEERRFNPCFAGIAQKLCENAPALLLILSGVVEPLTEEAASLALPRKLRIERIEKAHLPASWPFRSSCHNACYVA